ncbi:FecCD family ABC transporter permease [Cetobacterium somerae]
MKNIQTTQTYWILVIASLASFMLCFSVGSVNIPLSKIVNVLKFNLLNFGDIDKVYNGILWYIRVPRIIVAFLVGGGLAISGATIQSLFQNPMADPGILGISSGASLGAIIAIALGLTSMSVFYMPIIAILFAFLAGSLVYKLASYKGKTSILGLILSGIAIKTFLGAINALLLTNISDDQMKEFLFWSMGNLSGRQWNHVYLAGVPIIGLSYYLTRYHKELNILLLGDEHGVSLGINVNRFRRKILIVTSIITGLAVCVSGSIGFVGLVIPHILRVIKGSDNRYILPMSFFLGGIFLINADLISRIVISPKEVSIGIVTALIGAPYFIYLLLKYKKESMNG